MTQKKALNTLIQNMQKSYFKTKKLSETEYTIKFIKFKELIRDIDRQIMVLKEDIFKTKRRKKR
jgi:glucose-6-phosphate isomerase